MIIGITGLIGSGKSTIAKHLIEKHKFKLIKFAGALKDMGRVIGLTDDHLEGDLKNVPCELLCGKTPRQFMQLLGTEFGRQLIGQDFWMQIWKKRVHDTYLFQHIVVDDVRFPNEAEAIHAQGYNNFMITVKRKGVSAESHVSENSLGDIGAIVYNDGTIEDMLSDVDGLISNGRLLV